MKARAEVAVHAVPASVPLRGMGRAIECGSARWEGEMRVMFQFFSEEKERQPRIRIVAARRRRRGLDAGVGDGRDEDTQSWPLHLIEGERRLRSNLDGSF